MRWPLPNETPSLPGYEGSFGAIRKHDVHTGVDLYCTAGAEVGAIEEGEVIGVLPFTGPHADSPWWNDTYAVLIQGASGIFCYGEIQPEVQVGWRVKEGESIGVVIPVLKKNKGKPMSMLHLELYVDPMREPVVWALGQTKPEGLVDPTFILKGML